MQKHLKTLAFIRMTIIKMREKKLFKTNSCNWFEFSLSIDSSVVVNDEYRLWCECWTEKGKFAYVNQFWMHFGISESSFHWERNNTKIGRGGPSYRQKLFVPSVWIEEDSNELLKLRYNQTKERNVWCFKCFTSK